MWVQQRRVMRTDFVYNPLTATWAPAASEPQVAYLFPPERAARVPYQGVKGWLLFFCFCLTFLAPLGTAHRIMTVYDEVRPVLETNPVAKVVFMGDVIVSSALIVFSFYAGASLWKLRPHAVTKAKVYLVTYLLYTIAVFGLVVLGGGAKDLESEEFVQLARGFAFAFFFFAVWFAYLCRAKRVRATYGVGGS
jgi:hypothetical protein